ncbi:hypothetical protein OR263_14310 [Streptomyces sp. NEAU-H22]|nr:hypothetical protein [Streptomyces sp. NEAU-H22]MCX3287864.1 hypothetical protein [Streptomyces sp. NEAU-H22]
MADEAAVGEWLIQLTVADRVHLLGGEDEVTSRGDDPGRPRSGHVNAGLRIGEDVRPGGRSGQDEGVRHVRRRQTLVVPAASIDRSRAIAAVIGGTGEVPQAADENAALRRTDRAAGCPSSSKGSVPQAPAGEPSSTMFSSAGPMRCPKSLARGEGSAPTGCAAAR